MNITIVISQMCVMLLIILMGYLMFRKNKLSDESSRHISGLVVNLCNPAVMICSAFEEGEKASLAQLGTALGATLLLYAILLLAGRLLPRLIRTSADSSTAYRLLTVYGNVGFLGIPLVSAVLGNRAIIYVSINCLVFNVLFYTSGIGTIRKQAGISARPGVRDLFSKLVNVGTVSALLTVFFYLGDFDIPMIIRDTFTYTGRATTFLSMLVLGVSVAQMPFREIFSHKKDYLYVALRMLLLPILCTLLLKKLVADPLILGTAVLLIASPAANLPLMCSREHGLKADVLARNIILTTLLSVVTIPLVVLFL